MGNDERKGKIDRERKGKLERQRERERVGEREKVREKCMIERETEREKG